MKKTIINYTKSVGFKLMSEDMVIVAMLVSLAILLGLSYIYVNILIIRE